MIKRRSHNQEIKLITADKQLLTRTIIHGTCLIIVSYIDSFGNVF